MPRASGASWTEAEAASGPCSSSTERRNGLRVEADCVDSDRAELDPLGKLRYLASSPVGGR
eukprot:624316-Alexandrium_andersonii.AAC.1